MEGEQAFVEDFGIEEAAATMEPSEDTGSVTDDIDAIRKLESKIFGRKREQEESAEEDEADEEGDAWSDSQSEGETQKQTVSKRRINPFTMKAMKTKRAPSNAATDMEVPMVPLPISLTSMNRNTLGLNDYIFRDIDVLTAGPINQETGERITVNFSGAPLVLVASMYHVAVLELSGKHKSSISVFVNGVEQRNGVFVQMLIPVGVVGLQGIPMTLKVLAEWEESSSLTEGDTTTTVIARVSRFYVFQRSRFTQILDVRTTTVTKTQLSLITDSTSTSETNTTITVKILQGCIPPIPVSQKKDEHLGQDPEVVHILRNISTAPKVLDSHSVGTTILGSSIGRYEPKTNPQLNTTDPKSVFGVQHFDASLYGGLVVLCTNTEGTYFTRRKILVDAVDDMKLDYKKRIDCILCSPNNSCIDVLSDANTDGKGNVYLDCVTNIVPLVIPSGGAHPKELIAIVLLVGVQRIIVLGVLMNQQHEKQDEQTTDVNRDVIDYVRRSIESQKGTETEGNDFSLSLKFIGVIDPHDEAISACSATIVPGKAHSLHLCLGFVNGRVSIYRVMLTKTIYKSIALHKEYSGKVQKCVVSDICPLMQKSGNELAWLVAGKDSKVLERMNGKYQQKQKDVFIANVRCLMCQSMVVYNYVTTGPSPLLQDVTPDRINIVAAVEKNANIHISEVQ